MPIISRILGSALLLVSARGIQYTRSESPRGDDTKLTLAFGSSSDDQLCVTAESPVTCTSDAADYGKRINAELQPNKDPAKDKYTVTVDEEDPKKVCVERTDKHESAGWGQDLQIECDINVCVCDNGTPESEGCKGIGQSQCSACEDGFSLKEDGSACEQNVCVCENGTPEDEAGKCAKEGDSLCKECKDGFSLNKDNTACEANVCVCENGMAEDAEGKCLKAGDTLCKDCETGFSLASRGTGCEVNTCVCDNGTPEEKAGKCPKAGDTLCKSCDKGFTLNSKQSCDANICKCKNGKEVTGEACLEHNKEICGSCDNGYTLSHRGFCEKDEKQVGALTSQSRHSSSDKDEVFVCTCSNGKEKRGAACTKSGEMCSSCDKGYSLVERKISSVCNPNRCLCRGGDPVDQNDCSVDGATQCKACKTGYKLVHGACERDSA